MSEICLVTFCIPLPTIPRTKHIMYSTAMQYNIAPHIWIYFMLLLTNFCRNNLFVHKYSLVSFFRDCPSHSIWWEFFVHDNIFPIKWLTWLLLHTLKPSPCCTGSSTTHHSVNVTLPISKTVWNHNIMVLSAFVILYIPPFLQQTHSPPHHTDDIIPHNRWEHNLQSVGLLFPILLNIIKYYWFLWHYTFLAHQGSMKREQLSIQLHILCVRVFIPSFLV